MPFREIRHEGLGFGIQGLGFRDLGFSPGHLGFRVHGLGSDRLNRDLRRWVFSPLSILMCFEVFFGVSSFNIAFQGMSGKVSRLFGILAASGVLRIKDL